VQTEQFLSWSDIQSIQHLVQTKKIQHYTIFLLFSTVTLTKGKLPPLLPRVSLDDQEVSDIFSKAAKKREKKEKRLAPPTSELAPLKVSPSRQIQNEG